MTSSAHARQALAERSGLLRRKDHPELVTSLDWLVRSGELQSVLPGVLASTGMADDFERIENMYAAADRILGRVDEVEDDIGLP